MFSLVGSFTKQTLLAEIWEKKLRAITAATVCVTCVGLAALAPAYIDSDRESLWPFVSSDNTDFLAELPASGEYGEGVTQQENAKQLLLVAQEQMNAFPATSTLNAMRVHALLNADIRLVRVAIVQGVYTITGNALSRDALLQLRAAYRADTEHFSKADIPIAQLSGKDGEFPFTLTVVPVGVAREEKKK